jgi:UDP-N-acetylglucosamine 3-dehydrogenase
MSESKIRVGILGSGAMGTEHAGCYGSIDGVEVAGVFSRDRERASVAARICGARPVTDAMELIDDTSIDAIDVSVPSANHSQFVIAALKKGKHVFCETPFALSIDDARAMIDAARESKRVLMVGLLMRSIVEYQHVHRVAISGEHGKLLSVTAYRLGSYLRPDAPDHKPHYSEPSTELMTFDFDFINWLMGPPARISATAVNTERGTPGEISAMLDYGGARNAMVLASGIMPKSFPFSAGFRAVFERGAFELETVFQAGGPPKSDFTFFPDDGASRAVDLAGSNPYEEELRLFVSTIRGEADGHLLDAEHAMKALSMSIATQRSLRELRAIELK